MAATTISIEQEQFCCSVCLEVLSDPVTIPCGHSYCLGCIEDYWNRPKQRGQYSCPQCRQVFNPKPLLCRNTVLAEVVDKFQRTGLQPPAPPPSKAEGIRCTVCTGRKAKAVWACRGCSGSYCAVHAKAHEERFHGRGHKLVPASGQVKEKEKLCAEHDKVQRMYCRTDQNPVCSQCVKEAHRGHDTGTLVEERATQQKKLQDASLKSIQKMKDVEKELRYAVRYIKHSTEAAVEESERVFSRLIHCIEKQSMELRELLRVQERAAVTQAEELLEKIQRDMAELRRTDAELEKLRHTDDHIHFLQKCKCLHFPVKSVEMPSTDKLTYMMFKSMRGALTDLKDTLDQVLEREFTRISEKVVSLKESNNQSISEKTQVKDTDVASNSEPKTRADFLQYYSDIALDPNTANPFLWFTDGRRGVTTRSDPQPYPDHPDRFSSWAQVLCRAGMAGRCYWEVEWAGTGGVSVGVCYKNMSRSGGASDSKLGHNAKSWSLDCSHAACWFQHNQERTAVGVPCGSRIGVYLDFRGGTLAFYSISHTMVLLHKAKTTFTQPLYPGFWVGLGSSLKLCAL